MGLFDKSRKARSSMGTENRRRKSATPATLLDYDAQQAEALGYGCHYGKYKADHPNTELEFERLTKTPARPKVAPDRYERVCARCGATFYTTQNVQKKYCSPECKHEVEREKERQAKIPGHMKPCKNCGKEFLSYRGTKYCCAECLETGRKVAAQRLREKYKQEGRTRGKS